MAELGKIVHNCPETKRSMHHGLFEFVTLLNFLC